MGEINWESDEVAVADILKGMLRGIEEPEYRYTDIVESNPLEKCLYDYATRISLNRPNLLSVMALDRLGVVGEKLVSLWHLCDDNDEYFEKTVSYLTGTTLSKCFTPEEIINNLSLDEPIPFIPNDEVIPFFADLMKVAGFEYDDIIFALRVGLVKKYNEAVKNNSSSLPLLSMPERVKEEVTIDKRSRVNPVRLYFGLVTRDMTGGVLGLNMEEYGLFEASPNVIKIGNKIYHSLKDLEDGSFVMIDEEGKKVDWEESVDFEGESLLPTKQVVRLYVGPLKNIIKDAIEHGIESPAIAKYKEMLINGANVEECEEMLKDLSDIYTELYGGISKPKGL